MVVAQFVAMFKARTMEFVRDKGTFAWNLLFPVLLVFGLSFAFSGGDDRLFKIGVAGAGEKPAILEMDQMLIVEYADVSEALLKLERRQIDMVVDLDSREYSINGESNKGRLLKELFTSQQLAASVPYGRGEQDSSSGFAERMVEGRGTRYVDWLVPGVIGMNMMFSSLFGVGYVIVRYRKNGVLKRFKATPVHALNFVGAQAASRLVIVLATSVFVYIGTNFFLDFIMRGSYIHLLLTTALAILCMIALGLVFAARMRSEELAGGVLNLVTFPMLALSGVFFSLEGSPPILRTISLAFPLTHFTDAARKIMLDGAGLVQILPNLLVLGGLTALFLILGAALFKWE